MLTLTQLNIYPIKSCKGISLRSAGLEERGLQYDRRWMVVDENNRFISQREQPRLALVAVSVAADHLVVSAPGMHELHIPFALLKREPLSVVIWNDIVSAMEVSSEDSEWFSRYLGITARLVYMPDDADRLASRRGYSRQVSFADGYPLMLISEASLEDLNTLLDEQLPMNRFRPNLVVKGCDPYAEDQWTEISIGSEIFHVVKPCERCTIPTVNQRTADKGQEPLRTLATYRANDGNVLFGMNLIHETSGTLNVGDEVRILSHQELGRI